MGAVKRRIISWFINTSTTGTLLIEVISIFTVYLLHIFVCWKVLRKFCLWDNEIHKMTIQICFRTGRCLANTWTNTKHFLGQHVVQKEMFLHIFGTPCYTESSCSNTFLGQRDIHNVPIYPKKIFWGQHVVQKVLVQTLLGRALCSRSICPFLNIYILNSTMVRNWLTELLCDFHKVPAQTRLFLGGGTRLT